ncbi:MAG: hypothetical protein K5659_08100 [Lachnospiraceae bacterium]|nr:hypothetical protein [Lachnospiraceae bacterium]
MKKREKVINNKIMAKTALAAVSIAVIASLMSGKTVDAAVASDNILKEQDGVVIVWEWNRIDNNYSVKDFLTESYANPTPVLIVPYDPVSQKTLGQPVSLYADSDHMKVYDSNYANQPTPEFYMWNRMEALELDGMSSNDPRRYEADKKIMSIMAYDKCSVLSTNDTRNAIINYYTNSKPDATSMILKTDNDNDVISYDDLHSSKFYTGGTCRGCLWFTSTNAGAYRDKYDGYSANIICTLSQAEAKEKMSAALKHESIFQVLEYLDEDRAKRAVPKDAEDGSMLAGTVSNDKLVSDYKLGGDFCNLFLEDSGRKENDKAYSTFLGAYTTENGPDKGLQTRVHFGTQNSKGFLPVSIYGVNYGKRVTRGKEIIGWEGFGTSATSTGVPSGATFLVYDNGLLYGDNTYAGTFTYTVTGSVEFIVSWDVTSETNTVTVNMDQAMNSQRKMANEKGGCFTNQYAMYYGKEYLFTAFKGETNEISTDGRPTTVISEIRTVGGTTYEDENGAVITTEGEILCEGSTIEVPEGAVLSVDGNFVNNGKIVVNGGTLIVKDGGIISQLGDTNEGCIIVGQGDSGEAGQVIVMPGGKILCTSFVNDISLMNGVRKAEEAAEANKGTSEVTVQPGLVMNAGSSLVNYGEVYCSSMVIDSRTVIEGKKGSLLETGLCNIEGYTFYAQEENYLGKLQGTKETSKDGIVNALTSRLMYSMAIGDEAKKEQIIKAVEICKKYFEDYKVVNVKGEGKPIILLEDDSASAHGFGDEVSIKFSEY